MPFHSAIMRNADFRNGNYDTGFVERFMNSENFELQAVDAAARIDCADRERRLAECGSTAFSISVTSQPTDAGT